MISEVFQSGEKLWFSESIDKNTWKKSKLFLGLQLHLKTYQNQPWPSAARSLLAPGHHFWMWDASTPPSAKHRYHYHYKYIYRFHWLPHWNLTVPPCRPEVSRGPTWWNSRPIIRPGPRTLERRVFFKGQPVDPELVKSCQVMCHVGTNSLVIECWQNVVVTL